MGQAVLPTQVSAHPAMDSSILILILTLGIVSGKSGVVKILLESAVGAPTFHRQQTWKFDPGEAQRLNPDFEAANGHLSVNLIEKFGLGIDGQQRKRLKEQRLRDSFIPITGYNSPPSNHATLPGSNIGFLPEHQILVI